MATTNKGIYYPNNYSNVADVPEDMKKLAESVDTVVGNLDTNKVDKVDGKGLSTNDFTNEDKEKLDGLENYDDTEITQEIEDIQEEQAKQNEDIEDLKQINAKQDDLIQKLKDNSINVTTEEATQLQVQDASTVPAKLEVRGNHSQETRDGYNIFNYLDVVFSSAIGLTIEKDYENGYIIVNGTPNVSYAILFQSVNIDDLLEDGQTYTLWQENYSDTSYGGVYLQVSQNPKAGSEGSQTHYESSKGKKTFTVNKSLYDYVVTLQAGPIATAGTFNNYKNRYMLYKGTDEKSYELPGASPSLDYPSEVRALGDNVNIFKDIIYNNFVVNNSAKKEATGTEIKVTTIAISNCRNIFR